MTVYELIRSIPEEKLKLMVSAKIITPEWKRAVSVYEFYMQQVKKTGRMDAYDLTGQHYFMSDENVRKIVCRMRREV